MISQAFGKTGLQIPPFSLGMMRSMQSWQDVDGAAISKESQRKMESIVQRALELGINHLETARGYGSSERQLGEILKGIPREQFILQTKVGLEEDSSLFSDNVLDSLDRLQQQRVDLLALHGINDYRSLHQACRPGGCLAAARRLQEQGRVGWVGFSGHGSTEVILDTVRHEQDGGFDYVNLHWYTIFQRHSPVLEMAKARNLGVFIISPSDKGGMLQCPSETVRELSHPLTPMQFNDLYCLQRPEIHTISLGAGAPGDFAEHIAALDFLEDQALIAAIYGKWAGAMEQATGHSRPDAMWDSLPSWEKTPGYMNIQLILWLDNLVRGWDLKEYACTRYRKLGKDMPWVPGNHAGDAAGYDLMAIAADIGMSGQGLLARLQGIHERLC